MKARHEGTGQSTRPDEGAERGRDSAPSGSGTARAGGQSQGGGMPPDPDAQSNGVSDKADVYGTSETMTEHETNERLDSD